MKWNTTYIIGRLILCVGMMLLLTTCTEDSVQDGENTDLLQLVGLNTELLTEQTRLTNYADYREYNTEFLKRTLESGAVSMGVFMSSTSGEVSPLSRFVYLGTTQNEWESMVEVKQGVVYYIYGYMPVEAGGSASVEKLETTANYADGAILTLSGISPVSEYDLCVISGVHDVTNSGDLEQGKYKYVGKERGNNRVQIMLDHLYASICVDMKVDEQYNDLRTIKLKKVSLASTAVGKVNAALTLRANEPYQVNWGKTTGTAESRPFYEHEEGLTLSTTATTQPMYGYFVPITEVINSLALVCTYDVYDKKGNLLRKDCTAANQLSTLLSNLRAGEQQRFHLTVSPTYLYQLSDADLDNPTFTVENN